MIVLGVTGSIGMGKSTTCRMLQQMGVPLHDADATVHRLLAAGGAAVAPVAAAFAGVQAADGSIDRSALRGQVLGQPAALRRLEAILHPLVRAEKRRFLGQHRRRRTPLVVLDIPLLFETQGEKDCDAVLVVSASALIQRQRVLARPGMSEATLRAILARQMPDSTKRRRADAVLPTGLGKAVAFRHLRRFLRCLCRTRLEQP